MLARRFVLMFTLISGLGSLVGCRRVAPPPATTAAPQSVSPAQRTPPPIAPRLDGRHEFTLRGVVEAVEPAEGEVTIAHEAMPGFMEAMTMPFLVKNKAALAEIEPGDVVTGSMVVDFRQGNIKNYELLDLTPTGLVAPSKTASTPAPGLASGSAPVVLRVGDLVPDFAMTTQTGATLRLADLRGKVVALTFIYTRCPLPDFCPAADAKFAELARRIRVVPGRADHVALLSVSFDPEHDTPAVLERHAQLRGARPPWMFAVASSAELARVGPPLGLNYFPDRDQFAHNLTTAVIDPQGRLSRLELGRKWTVADLLPSVIGLLPKPHQP